MYHQLFQMEKIGIWSGVTFDQGGRLAPLYTLTIHRQNLYFTGDNRSENRKKVVKDSPVKSVKHASLI